MGFLVVLLCLLYLTCEGRMRQHHSTMLTIENVIFTCTISMRAFQAFSVHAIGCLSHHPRVAVFEHATLVDDVCQFLTMCCAKESHTRSCYLVLSLCCCFTIVQDREIAFRNLNLTNLSSVSNEILTKIIICTIVRAHNLKIDKSRAHWVTGPKTYKFSVDPNLFNSDIFTDR